MLSAINRQLEQLKIDSLKQANTAPQPASEMRNSKQENPPKLAPEPPLIGTNQDRDPCDEKYGSFDKQEQDDYELALRLQAEFNGDFFIPEGKVAQMDGKDYCLCPWCGNIIEIVSYNCRIFTCSSVHDPHANEKDLLAKKASDKSFRGCCKAFQIIEGEVTRHVN